MLEFSEQLYSLLASPYSYIQIRTYEERRIVQTVRALAEQMGRPLLEWAPGEHGAEGLLEVLGGMAQRPRGTVLVLKDIHPYLGTPRVVRRLREMEPVLARTHQVAVMVSPFVECPRELIKDVTFLDAPLPGRVELTAVLDEVLPSDAAQSGPASGGTSGQVVADPRLRERMVAAALGLTLREAERAYHRVGFEREQARRRGVALDLEAAVIREKRRLIEADRVLSFSDLSESLEDVGGLEALKGWLQERAGAFTEAAADFGLPVPRGLLLTGVQGCGKSLVAKAVASYWGIPLLQLDVARLFDGGIPPESALRRAIDTAEALSPAVLWIDEIDKAFGQDTGGSLSRMMASLLNWLQDKRQPVFLVATANRVQTLPPELLRKGRFDEIFFVDLPSERARAEILAIHLRKRRRRPEVFDLSALAESTRYFSGAELEQVVVSGLYKAFAEGRELRPVDLELAIHETIPLYRTYEDEIKALRQWAESRARSAGRDERLLDLFRSG